MRPRARDPSCKNVVARATDRREGALPPDEAAAYDSHVAGCAACRNYVAQLESTIHTAAASRTSHLSEETLAMFRELYRKNGA